MASIVCICIVDPLVGKLYNGLITALIAILADEPTSVKAVQTLTSVGTICVCTLGTFVTVVYPLVALVNVETVFASSPVTVETGTVVETPLVRALCVFMTAIVAVAPVDDSVVGGYVVRATLVDVETDKPVAEKAVVALAGVVTWTIDADAVARTEIDAFFTLVNISTVPAIALE